MKRSHRDRLISSLPADLQAGVLDALNNYSTDGDSMVEAIFAALIDTNKRTATELKEKLAESERREKELAAQLAQAHAENLKAMRQEVGALSGKSLWRRIFASRFVGAALWVAVFSYSLYLAHDFIDTKIRTVDPEFHEKLDAQAEREEKTQRNLEEGFATIGPVTTHTIVGEQLSTYISSVDPTGFTITIGNPRKQGELTEFRVPHHMTPEEYNKLKRAYLVPKQFK